MGDKDCRFSVSTKVDEIMIIYIIIASINVLSNIAQLKEHFINSDHTVKVLIIDEGNEQIRGENADLLRDICYEFYGPRERSEWFRQRFSSGFEKFSSVIPVRCHAETSFGFLLAYEEDADIVIELDDDVFPIKDENLIKCHIDNLSTESGTTVYSRAKWYNTIENLVLNTDSNLFPRGHPYSPDVRACHYYWADERRKCVLNMGLWKGHPDLDALTILYYGGLNGQCRINSVGLKRGKVIVGKKTYFSICSMNTAFSSKIIPAFYQLHMNCMGIDRFDDIWSGIFLKKIADHLGDALCIGMPSVYHNKRPRNVFKDLRKELEGMAINEYLWRIVDEIEIKGKTYYDCYASLVDCLEDSLPRVKAGRHERFLRMQLEKMRLWLQIMNRLN